MRKPITWLNIALLAVSVWMAIGIRGTWQRNHARYAVFAATLPRAARTTAAAPSAGSTATPPVVGDPSAGYSELVARNLFSPDRNNDQPVVKTEKKPAPPVPVVIGTLNLGSGMVALMAEPQKAQQGSFRRLRVGDEIGGYKVAEIAEHRVILDFEGERKVIDVYESADSVRPQTAGGAPVAAAPAANQQVTTAVSSAPAAAQPSSPQAAPQADPYAPVPGNPTADPYLTWVVEGNRKKFSRRTPFGVQTWYEDLPAGTKP